jgi:ubiquinone/menaquinone biosynthesis C-methylase UbiE
LAQLHAPEIKRNWRRLGAVYKDTRSEADITEHYLLERTLAERLQKAPASERQELYSSLYDELYARLPRHPRHTRRYDANHAGKQVTILRRLVPRGASFLEIGAGDGAVSLAMSEMCSEAIAVDVTERAIIGGSRPANFKFALSDGIGMPVPSGTIDFAYSHQLMEHLHPEDAFRQLAEIFRVLRPGGTYLCITPSRLTGPHDVSRYFDREAQGFHLKEYSYREMEEVFGRAGFTRIRACIMRGDRFAGTVGIGPIVAVEKLYDVVPGRLRESLNTNRYVRAVLGISVLAEKPAA